MSLIGILGWDTGRKTNYKMMNQYKTASVFHDYVFLYMNNDYVICFYL